MKKIIALILLLVLWYFAGMHQQSAVMTVAVCALVVTVCNMIFVAVMKPKITPRIPPQENRFYKDTESTFRIVVNNKSRIPINRVRLRISMRYVTLNQSFQDEKVIIPGKTLSELSKILTGDLDSEVTLYFTPNTVLFAFDQTIVVSRLVEGEYFRIDQMLPTDYEISLQVSKKEMLDCLERSLLLVRENDKKPLILDIRDDEMNLSMNSSIGALQESIPIQKTGPDLLIGFNPRFMLDALRVIDEDTVTLYMINAKAPCFIRDKGENYIYLILPVNFATAR